MNEEKFLAAIHDDDLPTVKKLLSGDETLATHSIGKARLYEEKIVHWIYVRDTPLHLAAAGHRTEIVRLLLAVGADSNSCLNHRRGTSLHYAADGRPNLPAWNATKQIETIQCLLEAGADIDAQDKNGATPLHRAVRTRSAAAVSCLLRSECDATLRNKSGSAAFHLAVQNTGHGGTGTELAKIAQEQIITAFLASGASVKLKDGKGKSVLDCAQSVWVREMLRV